MAPEEIEARRPRRLLGFEAPLSWRDSPFRFGISLSEVGGPLNAPRKIDCRRRCVASTDGLRLMADTDFKFLWTGNISDLETFGRMPEDHPAFAAIGRVAAEWAHFEHVLDMIIWDLVCHPEYHPRLACLTAQLIGSAGRFRAIISLLNERATSNLDIPPNLKHQEAAINLAKRFKALMGRSFDASEERNRIVHDAWFTSKKTGEAAQFRAMPFREPHYGVEIIDSNSFKGTVEKIRDLSKQATALKNEVLALLEASHERPR